MKAYIATIQGLLTAVFTLLVLPAAGQQIPAGYYNSLKGKSGAELKTAVHNIIKKADVLSYGSGNGATWSGFYKTDRRSDNSVVERYSLETFYFSSSTSAADGMNIEHSFPKSWWGGSKNQAYCDLFNLMPSKINANSAKANYPMGVVTGSASFDNGAVKVGSSGNGYNVWEPIAKWRGDFSRSMMYMATAYQNLTWSGNMYYNVLEQNSHPTLKKWAYTLYIKWAQADPVDDIEVKRNEAVYQIQGNRNPYVDFPNLKDYIWGDSMTVAFNPETTLKSAPMATGISETIADGGKFDPSKPYTVYTLTGRRTTLDKASGLVIIRQNGRAYKVVR